MTNLSTITKIFDEKTAELLAQGYSLFLEGMRGHQGEIGKVAFTKNNRYFMLVAHGVKYSLSGPDTIVVEFGEAAEGFRPDDTFWISELRNSVKTIFYRLGDSRHGYFTADKAAADAAYQKNLDRHEARRISNGPLRNSEKALETCFKITRKTAGYKTLAKKNIRGYYVENWNGRITYVIDIISKPNIRLSLKKI